jgi:hypothetical protein
MFIFFTNCNVYKKPMTIQEAVDNTEQGYYKVNMKNGDEVIYESIEKIDAVVYGIKTIENNVIKTPLVNDQILNIQKQNKKATSTFKIIGITIGVGSVLLGVGMF